MTFTMDISQFKSPAFLINEQICRQNIRQMAEKAKSANVVFRPHFKTHQSVEVGKWFRQEGVNAITVSSVSMARYFATDGWDDITIAFPVNIREVDDIIELAGEINLNVLFDMAEQAEDLTKKLKHKVGFFIKIDVGYHRAGIEATDLFSIDKILSSSKNSELIFRGFLTHPGHTYHAAGKQEILAILNDTSRILSGLKHRYQNSFPGIISSTGDTPSCSLAADFSGIDEIRPGNFVFYDLMQLRLGACHFTDIGAAVICPVVSVYPQRNEALIYGGAVHLSKESLPNPDGSKHYGLIVPFNNGIWHNPEGNDYLFSLSQEHGIFCTTSVWAKTLKPGELVAVIPVHSCLAADLFRIADCGPACRLAGFGLCDYNSTTKYEVRCQKSDVGCRM